MNKAFTKEDDGTEDAPVAAGFPDVPSGIPNRITAPGRQAFLEEIARLESKPALEPFDAARLASLRARADTWVVTESESGLLNFGRVVHIRNVDDDTSRSYAVVGIDEADPSRSRISWLSPMGRALLNARADDLVTVAAPSGPREFEVERVDS
jgi:transcription elongation GreA/GreB family factor